MTHTIQKLTVVTFTFGSVLIITASAAAAQADTTVQIGCPAGGCPGGTAIKSFVGMIGQYGIWASLGCLLAGFGIYAWNKMEGGAHGMTKGMKVVQAALVAAGGFGMAASLFTQVFNTFSA